MNKEWKQPVWLVLSVAALFGCATQTQNASLQCGAGAAATTFLMCKVMGKSNRDCVTAGVLIGVGGVVICYGYASSLEKRRRQLASRENNLDARIRYVQGLNQDSQQFNTELRTHVAAVSHETDTLVAEIQQRRVTNERLVQERQARDNEVRLASEQVAKGNEALQEVKTYRAQNNPQSAELDASIARQEQLLVEAQRQVDLLTSQRERVT